MGMLWLWACRDAHRNSADGTEVHLNMVKTELGRETLIRLWGVKVHGKSTEEVLCPINIGTVALPCLFRGTVQVGRFALVSPQVLPFFHQSSNIHSWAREPW